MGQYTGLDRYECRKEIVKDLEAEGALIEIEDYSHNVGTCYRCHTSIEPRLSKQWFVKMEPLASLQLMLLSRAELNLFPSVLIKYITIGWRISKIGVFPVSFGGVTEFRLGTVMNVVR